MLISRRARLLSAAALVVVLVVLAAWWATRGGPRAADTPTGISPGASLLVTGSTTTAVPAGARGCLGGENAEAAILVAQQQAPLTPTGAAEFAATLTRWYFVYPRSKPLTADGPSLWAEGIDKERMTPQWPAAGNGDSAYASFIDGHYLIESATADTVTVSIQFTGVYNSANGQMKAEQGATESTLKVVDGHWRLSAARGYRQAPEVIANGQAFVRGC